MGLPHHDQIFDVIIIEISDYDIKKLIMMPTARELTKTGQVGRVSATPIYNYGLHKTIYL